jgi:hypothetical protein
MRGYVCATESLLSIGHTKGQLTGAKHSFIPFILTFIHSFLHSFISFVREYMNFIRSFILCISN